MEEYHHAMLRWPACLLLLAATACSFAPAVTTQQALAGSGRFVAASGVAIDAVYFRDGTVALRLPDGTRKVLRQARSASGARYVQGTQEWWEHQGEATWSVDGKPVFVGEVQRR